MTCRTQHAWLRVTESPAPSLQRPGASVPRQACATGSRFPLTVALLLAAAYWPVATSIARSAPTGEPEPNRVAADLDRLLAQELGEPPAGTAGGPIDDLHFLRRVTFDLIGQPPTPEEIRAFGAQRSATKRSDKVAQLLDDPRYGENWARYWRDVILSRRVEDRALIVARPLTAELTEAINNNDGWDTIARRFITARGDIREEGSTAIFVAQQARPEETTAEMCRILLGIQIQCAQCHDHVTDRWTREQFHQLAAFFPRVALRPVRDAKPRTFRLIGVDRKLRRRRPAAANRRRPTPEHRMPDLEHPTSPGKLMTPTFFLTGETLPLGTSDARRRATLARWITSNRWFAVAYVNRLWTELVGWGFYSPVDDIGPDREPLAPRSIDMLAEQFVAAGYDTKWLFRTIMATRAYQAASTPASGGDGSPAQRPWQRLRADQLYDALVAALDIAPPAKKPGRRQTDAPRPRRRRRDARAALMATFGYDPSVPRQELVGSIPQALMMMNAPQLARYLRAADSRTMLGRLLQSTDDDRTVIEHLYLRCLARRPSPSERQICLDYIRQVRAEQRAGNRRGQGPRARPGRADGRPGRRNGPAARGRREAFEDILWSLINSAEFLHRT